MEIKHFFNSDDVYSILISLSFKRFETNYISEIENEMKRENIFNIRERIFMFYYLKYHNESCMHFRETLLRIIAMPSEIIQK